MVSCCSFTLTNSQLSIDRTIVWLVVVVRFSPFVHPSLIAPPFATSSPCHSRSCCRDSQMGWYGSAKPAWSAEGWCNWNWTSTYRSMVFVDLDVPQLGSIRNQKKLNMCSLSLLRLVLLLVASHYARSQFVISNDDDAQCFLQVPPLGNCSSLSQNPHQGWYAVCPHCLQPHRVTPKFRIFCDWCCQKFTQSMLP